MITVHCYLWREGGRGYLPEHVNTLARMVRRHLDAPHRFVCITDETDGFDGAVEVVPLPEAARAAATLRTPEGPKFPSSYRRLWSFSREAVSLGPRVLLLDIDCVVTADITPLVERTDDFVGYRPSHAWGKDIRRLMGGTWMLRTGTKSHVWDEFIADPEGQIRACRAAGHRGSDQAILSWKLYADDVLWPQACGIYSSQDMLKPSRHATLPHGARIVHFNGLTKPWTSRHIPWVREHYR